MSDDPVAAVDVLLPIRSPAPWLAETLAGLQRQTMGDWRLVVVVHGTDEALADVLTEAVPGCRILFVGSDLGLPEVLNTGLAACTAPLVARIDADDVPRPDRFATQVAYLADHPDVALVASPVAIMDESGRLTGRRAGPSGERELMKGLRWKCVIQHPSVMFRREIVERLGGYAPGARHVEDYELWLRLAAVAGLGTTSEPLTDYRLHDGQVTQTKVIGRPARVLVAEARRALAQRRHESAFMSRLRHSVWASRQVVREAGSRSH